MTNKLIFNEDIQRKNKKNIRISLKRYSKEKQQQQSLEIIHYFYYYFIITLGASPSRQRTIPALPGKWQGEARIEAW